MEADHIMYERGGAVKVTKRIDMGLRRLRK